MNMNIVLSLCSVAILHITENSDPGHLNVIFHCAGSLLSFILFLSFVTMQRVFSSPLARTAARSCNLVLDMKVTTPALLSANKLFIPFPLCKLPCRIYSDNPFNPLFIQLSCS